MLAHTEFRLRELTPGEVRAALSSAAVTLVDVREDHEWAQARIEGAIHAPLSRLAALAPDLVRSAPQDRPLVFQCLGGARSAQAVALCRSLGLDVDTHMAGGLQAWANEGLPLVR